MSASRAHRGLAEPCANPRPPDAELTIPQRLLHAARRWGPRPFLEGPHGSLTFAQLEDQVRRAAAALHRLGLRRGRRVAFPAPNSPSTVLTWWGASWLGATAVPFNPGLTSGERSALLEHARPALALEEELDLDAVPPWPRPPAARPLEPAVLIYTSGTTGQPKGVLQSQRTYVLTGEAFPRWLGLNRADRLLCLLPLFHVNAQAYSLMGALSHGLPVALLPRFSVSSFWSWVEAYRPSQVNLIGAMLMLLLEHSHPPQDHPLRLIYTAPALEEGTHDEVESRFGVRLVAGYGLSECTFGTIVPPASRRPGSMGRPRDLAAWGFSSQLGIFDERGTEQPPGEVGKIRLRNAAVFLGYHRDAARTRQALRDGWLHTGDLAHRDQEGFLYFAGRAGEVIRRRGELISAREVEEALLAHPDVRQAAVVGVPSPLTEEDVKAFVVLRPGSQLKGEGLARWCSRRLAEHKLPRFIEIVADLPRTPTERVARGLLRGPEAPRGELFDREAGRAAARAHKR